MKSTKRARRCRASGSLYSVFRFCHQGDLEVSRVPRRWWLTFFASLYFPRFGRITYAMLFGAHYVDCEPNECDGQKEKKHIYDDLHLSVFAAGVIGSSDG